LNNGKAETAQSHIGILASLHCPQNAAPLAFGEARFVDVKKGHLIAAWMMAHLKIIGLGQDARRQEIAKRQNRWQPLHAPRGVTGSKTASKAAKNSTHCRASTVVVL
jgi:hypothetical protein